MRVGVVPIAVRPRNVDTTCESNETTNEDDAKMVGVYVAGETEEDDLDWVPKEELEADQEAVEAARSGSRPPDYRKRDAEAGRRGRDPDAAEDGEDPFEDEIVCEPCGEVKARTWTNPVKPSAKEVAEHELTHCPYRNWCDVCVSAMGREDPHHRQEEVEEGALPVVGSDYDKYGEEERAENHITSIVLKDSDTGMIKGHVTEVKGPKDEWIIKRCCKDIEGMGH